MPTASTAARSASSASLTISGPSTASSTVRLPFSNSHRYRLPSVELIPMAMEMGLGVIPWSPLASGVLTGKYTRADLDRGGGSADTAGTRKNIAAASGALTERGLAIADVVKTVAAE